MGLPTHERSTTSASAHLSDFDDDIDSIYADELSPSCDFLAPETLGSLSTLPALQLAVSDDHLTPAAEIITHFHEDGLVSVRELSPYQAAPLLGSTASAGSSSVEVQRLLHHQSLLQQQLHVQRVLLRVLRSEIAVMNARVALKQLSAAQTQIDQLRSNLLQVQAQHPASNNASLTEQPTDDEEDGHR